MMGFGGGGIGMILFWVIIIAAVILIAKEFLSPTRREVRSPESPLEVLKRRYAAGEIGREEFESKRKDLIKG